MHIHHDSILTLELPYRERLALRRTAFHGGDGPKVAVLAGVHGDELEGLYVCHRLAAWLEDLASTHPEAFFGQVELFPAMNSLGLDTLQRLVPVYETDLNRNFPGHAQGPLPQRIAEAAMRHLHEAALVIDIHASTIFLREIPQVRRDGPQRSALCADSHALHGTPDPLRRERRIEMAHAEAGQCIHHRIGHRRRRGHC
jgi:uncharacterized protein